MGLVNAGVMLATLQSYRLCWISGRFGGGKTSFAYKAAAHYLDQGYRLVSNSKCVWAEDHKQINLDANGHLKCVVVLDEGGLWFKSSKQIEMVASYAAKMDVIYMLPSFWPPTRSAMVLVVQPVFNFKSAGLPIIAYKWRVKLGSFEDKGYFLWVRPSEIYGVYSRQDPGDSGAEIVDWLICQTEAFRKMHGRGEAYNPVQTMEVTEWDILSESVSEFAGAAESLVSLQAGKNKRR
jgi:hypothetical protein